MHTATPRLQQEKGPWAEELVLALLQRNGWRPLARNWRCRWGELDLVMAKPSRLLLVEVKARSRGSRDGQGRAALHGPKRLRLRRAWACWLAANPGWAHCPVELVAALVALPPARRPVRWLRLEAPEPARFPSSAG